MASAPVSVAPFVTFVYNSYFGRFLEWWLFCLALVLTLVEERGGNQRHFF